MKAWNANAVELAMTLIDAKLNSTAQISGEAPTECGISAPPSSLPAAPAPVKDGFEGTSLRAKCTQLVSPKETSAKRDIGKEYGIDFAWLTENPIFEGFAIFAQKGERAGMEHVAKIERAKAAFCTALVAAINSGNYEEAAEVASYIAGRYELVIFQSEDLIQLSKACNRIKKLTSKPPDKAIKKAQKYKKILEKQAKAHQDMAKAIEGMFGGEYLEDSPQ